MTTEAWPNDLPDCAGSWEESPTPDILRSSVDIGQAKVRRRSTIGGKTVSVGWTMDANTYAALVFFYETTLLEGVNSFYYNHPISGTQQTYRFLSPPNLIFVAGKSGVGAYQVTCEWELMP